MIGKRYIRDKRSGALIIRDDGELYKLKVREDLFQQIQSLKQDINSLKSELAEIKSLITKSN